MSNSLAILHSQLIQLSSKLLNSISKSNFKLPDANSIDTKSILQSLLCINSEINDTQLLNSIKNFTLACGLLSSSQSSTHELLTWVPNDLSFLGTSCFNEFSEYYVKSELGERNVKRVSEILGFDVGLVCDDEKRLVIELLLDVFPLLKDSIKESCIDKGDDADEISAASARTHVGFAIIAAYQFRWLVTQLDNPYLGKLCNLIMPCGLTALDHWSPEVKGQGMVSFIHLARNVQATDIGCFEDVILDACCQNMASADEIWHHVVEMSVLLVTLIQRNNPRSPWFERILNEMLSHLDRQPRNKDRRVPWLTHVEPLLQSVGLVLLAHFRWIFPLFFQWMHADDDETVLLVLKRFQTIIKVTWIRNTPYIERLVNELVVLYKDAALKVAREEIRTNVIEILVLLQQCKGQQFELSWNKHKDDPNLAKLASSLTGNIMLDNATQTEVFQKQSYCVQES